MTGILGSHLNRNYKDKMDRDSCAKFPTINYFSEKEDSTSNAPFWNKWAPSRNELNFVLGQRNVLLAMMLRWKRRDVMTAFLSTRRLVDPHDPVRKKFWISSDRMMTTYFQQMELHIKTGDRVWLYSIINNKERFVCRRWTNIGKDYTLS